MIRRIGCGVPEGTAKSRRFQGFSLTVRQHGCPPVPVVNRCPRRHSGSRHEKPPPQL